MAGKPGRSGGHNRLSIAEHLARGTFNPTRHGGRPARAAAAVVLPVEPVPPALIEGLTGPGKTFVTDCWQHYGGWTPPARALLHEAGRVLDDLAQLRGQRGERVAQRLLLSVLSQLQLRD